MANISLYEPFNSRMNRFISNFVKHPGFFDELDSPAANAFKLDVSEDDKNYFIRADLPGAKKEDIKVSVDGNQVSISAETSSHKEEKDGRNVIHTERYEGKFFRSFTLDFSVDESKSVAKFTDGVLELTLPKQPECSSSKQIKVQ